MKKTLLSLTGLFLLLSTTDLFAQKKVEKLSTQAAITHLETSIPEWMRLSDVQGLSIAMIRGGKLVWQKHFGVGNADTKQVVDDQSIFEAASLSKIVTAYTALKLVDEGKLSLDTALNQYLGNNYDVGDDARINLITTRRVLTHSAGFPNWRPQGSAKLPILFTPGERFSYSGEGFVYLAKVIEKITGQSFEEVVKQKVLVPLNMKNSSFIWLDSYANTHVYRHNGSGKVSFRYEGKGSNAAASLHTTAADYTKFVIALLNGTGLKKKTWEEMFRPHINVDAEKAPGVSWGLGVGLETTAGGPWFWHWGDQGDSKCYLTASLTQKDGIVYFTNSQNGLAFAKEILDDAVSGIHPALAWLNYPRYDPAAAIFMQQVIDNGAESSLRNYREQRVQNRAQAFTEAQVNTMGYKLIELKKTDDAILLFEQNTIDFPKSGNAWDSFAEGHMIKGNKELAIQYYQKSLELDPENGNAVEQIKKLKEK